MLVVRGAREHNLRNVSIELPRDSHRLHGAVGSGKSSLAFDTIYAEGQRRYVESLSAYARQFLGPDGQARRRLHRRAVAGHLDRPEVGLAQPTVDRRHDHRDLRLPPAAVRAHRHAALPELRHASQRQTPQQIVDRSSSCPTARGSGAGADRAGRKGEYEGCSTTWPSRASCAPASTARSSTSPSGEGQARPLRAAHHRGRGRPAGEARRHQAPPHRLVETALQAGRGRGRGRDRARRTGDERANDESLTFSQHLACPKCGIRFDELAPRNFSFNSPYGACATCDGLGTRVEVDPELVVPNADLSLDEGAIAPWAGGRGEYFSRRARSRSPRLRLHESTRRGRSSRRRTEDLLYGIGHQAGARAVPQPLRAQHTSTRTTRVSSRTSSAGTARPSPMTCASRSRATCARCRAPTCGGARSSPSRWRSRSAGATSSSSCDLSIGKAAEVLEALELSERDRMIAEQV